jgi:FkbM family methyltransferase
MAHGTFEREEIELFKKLLALSSVCVDVGANIGLYTCLAAASSRPVIAVEPAPNNLALLYRNLKSNGFASVEILPVGLASRAGLTLLYGGGTGASFVPGWAHTPENWNITVPVTTLDNLLAKRFQGIQLLIKLDVEGFEFEVLKGAESTLTITPPPIWLVEVCFDQHHPHGINHSFVDTFEIFYSRGYVARSADRHLRTVLREDVSRWVANRHVDFGSHNYLFTRGALNGVVP